MDAHPTVDALLRERDHCVRQGDPVRVGLIDEQLRLRGHVDPEAKPRRARKERAVKESAPERAVDD